MELVGYAASILIGLCLGLIGGGGSILTVPVMVYLFAVSPITATTYSLFVVGCTSIAGVIARINTGLVKPKTAVLFASSSIVTVFLTRKFIIPYLPDVLFTLGSLSLTKGQATMMLFALLMITAAVSMIRNKKRNDNAEHHVNYISLVIYGIGIGLVTGFLGAGGGFLIIPALVLLCGLRMKEAVGTSLLIIALNSAVGFMTDLGHVDINWRLLVTVTILAITGIVAGSELGKKIKNEKLKSIFGWFVLLMGIYIIVHEVFF